MEISETAELRLSGLPLASALPIGPRRSPAPRKRGSSKHEPDRAKEKTHEAKRYLRRTSGAPASEAKPGSEG